MIEAFSKPADQIGIRDIQSLIDSQVPEGEQIEFKESLPAKGDGSPDPWMSGGEIGEGTGFSTLPAPRWIARILAVFKSKREKT